MQNGPVDQYKGMSFCTASNPVLITGLLPDDWNRMMGEIRTIRGNKKEKELRGDREAIRSL